MAFKSKIAWWFYTLEVLMGGITVVMVYLCLTEQQIMLYIAAAIFLLFMGLLMVPMLLNTKYVLDENQLHISCGLSSQHISYSNILSIKPNFDPSSSPALSLDRVQIRYHNKDGNNNYISISPNDKERFIKELSRRMGH